MLLKEFKDVFAQIHKDLKNIPLELVQLRIELDTSIPLTHQARYILNFNYAVVVKHDIDKLLTIYSTGRRGYMVITHSGSA